MRARTVPALCLALAAAACSGGDVQVPDTEFAPRGWELAYGPEDMTAWRTGVLNRVEARPGEEFGALRPAEGATLELLAARPGGDLPLRVVATTTVGADGRFRIGPGPADGWVLRASLDGYATAVGGRTERLPGVLTLPDGEVIFGLRPAFPLEVVVRGEDGAALPGARVRAESAAYMQDEVADAEGIARFRAPPGGVMLHALDPARSPASVFTEVPRPAGSAPVELVAPVRGPVRGRVLDAETGAPLAGAVVLRIDDPTVRTTTDGDGRFALDSRSMGRVAAFARGHGWRSLWIRPGEEHEVRLLAARSARGTVVGPDGRPVPDARLFAIAALPDDVTERVWGPAPRADGTFAWDWLPAAQAGDAATVLVAYRRGLGWSAGAALPHDGAPVTLRLSGERVVEGAVTRASGAVEKGVPVRLELEPQGLSARQATVLGMPTAVQGAAGTDGRYRLAGVPANLSGVVRFDVDGAEFELPLEAGRDVADVRLELDGTLTIDGRVVDVHGRPVTAGGQVLVDLQNHARFSRLMRTARLGDDGTFRFVDLPAGTFGVRARVPGYDVNGAVVEAGASGVELVAEIPAPLDFEVRFPPGVDPGAVLIRLHDAEDPAARVRTETIEAGAAELRASMPLIRRGRYHVVARSGRWWVRMFDVPVPDGFRPPIVLEMERTSKVDVAVQDADGTPRPGSRLRVAPVGGTGTIAETFWSAEGGVAEVSGLHPGEWIVRIVEDGRPIVERRITVGDGDVGEVPLVFPPFGTLVLHVDPAVRAGSDAVAELRDGAGASCFVNGPGTIEKASRFRLPTSGPVRFTGVPAGPVEVILTQAGRELARRTVEVTPGDETSVRLP